MKKIKSIEKGTGEGSTYFAINDKYQYAPFGDKIHEIKEETKDIGWNCGQVTDYIRCYKGYDVVGQLLFEIEANSSLTVTYITDVS